MTRSVKGGITALAAALVLAGCGGGGHSTSVATHQTTTAPTTTTTPTTTSAAKPRKPAFIVETVHSSAAPGFQPTQAVKAGQTVVLHTALPQASKAQTVTVSVGSGPAKRLVVRATSKGHTAQAVLTSSDGKPITLTRLHYLCPLPPAPSACPAKKSTSSSSRSEVQFSTDAKRGVTLLAEVGPVAAPPSAAGGPVGTSVVPPYKVAEIVSVLPPQPHSGAKHPASSQVTAKPGDHVVMISPVHSQLHGAPQSLTLTIEQGPAKALKITAGVPGGVPASATITSADGKPISLVLPLYQCFLPPTPTFCPAKKVTVGARRYSLTFPAAPGLPAVVVLARVEAG